MNTLPAYVESLVTAESAEAMKRIPLPVAPELDGENPHENRAMDGLIAAVAAAGLCCACLIP